MQFRENFSLKPFNTFSIDAKAKYFTTFSNTEELLEATGTNYRLSSKDARLLILGGGSNILLMENFDGLVLKNEIKGIEIIKEDDDHVYVKAGAGENWHQFVLYCLKNNWAGVENLSLIPGNIGATPMQNIGAYGVEIKEVFHELKAFHLKERSNYTFGLNDCEFGYRDSVFKNKYKDQFVIMDVTFRLNKKPRFNTSYGAIEKELEQMDVKEITIQAISQAVINIRSSKLPDPAVIGNAGSFFKNPVVPLEKLADLKQQFPDIPNYPVSDQAQYSRLTAHNSRHFKLAAAWLIEQCGWKGFRRGDAGCHEKQALVLVNYGNAKGSEIFRLSEEILSSVREKFDVELEREVNIV